MGENCNIGKGLNFNLTRVSKKEISMDAVAGNKAKQIELFKKFDLNKDGKLNSVELAAAYDYMQGLDGAGDADGSLSKKEYKAGASALNEQLRLAGKSELSAKDLQNFMNSLVSNNNDNEQVDIKVLTDLAKSNANFDLQNVVDAKAIEGENGTTYVVTYKDGSTVNLNPDKSYNIKTTDGNSNVTTSYYDSSNVLTKSQVIYNDDAVPDNRTSETNEFVQLPNGETVISQKTTVNFKNGTTSVSNYSDGVLKSETTTLGKEQLVYEADGTGTLRLVRKQEPGSAGTNRISNYTYNDDGTVTVNIKDGNKTITQVRTNARNEGSTFKETIVEHTNKGDVTTNITYRDNERFEETTSPDKTVTKVSYNADNRRLASSIEKGDKAYFAEYDGNGNTYLVVSMNDKMQDLAKAGGFSSVEELFDYNKEQCRGNGKNRYFVAGATIKLKGELSADAPILQNRGTAEQEAAKFKNWSAQQKQLKQAEAEKADKAKIDKFKQEYDKKWGEETRDGKLLAEKLNAYLANHSFATGDEKFKAILDKITPENVLGVLEDKKLIDNICSEWGADSNTIALQNILEKLTKRAEITAKETGVKGFVVKGFHGNYDDYKVDIKSLSAQIKLIESTAPEERANVKNATGVALDAMDAQHKTATENLNTQLANDGFYADLWEGLKWLGGSDKLDEKVKADLEEYKGYKTRLDNALKTGGEKAFKEEFRAIFGRDFNPEQAKSYSVKQKNCSEAAVLTDLRDTLKKKLWKGTVVTSEGDRFEKDAYVEKTGFSDLKKAYSELLKKSGVNESCESILKQRMGDKYTTGESKQKTACLQEIVRESLDTLNHEIYIRTNGDSIEDMQKDLLKEGSAIFGPKNDIMQRVNEYVISQQEGAAYTETGVKILIAAGITFLTGGAGLSTLGAAATAGGGTFVAETIVDTGDHFWKKNGHWDNLDYETILKNAAIDGFAAGTLSGATNAVKINNVYVKTALKGSINSTGNMTVSAMKNGQSLSGTTLAAGVVIALLTRGKGSKLADAARNAAQLATDSVNSLSNFEAKGSSYTVDVKPASFEEVKNLLASESNLGELNSMKREIINLPDNLGIDKNEVCALIDKRANELRTNPSQITISTRSVSPEVRKNAMTALSSPVPSLRQDQLEDIMDYIGSLKDNGSLYNSVEQLKQHGIDLTVDSPIRQTLDDKFAELQLRPPYSVGSEFVLFTQNEGNINGESQGINTADYLTPSVLDSYINGSDNMGQKVYAQLDENRYRQIKDEVYEIAGKMDKNTDIKGLLAKLNSIGNDTQRAELLNIINSAARMNGFRA